MPLKIFITALFLCLTSAPPCYASSWRGNVVVTDGGTAHNLPTDGGAFVITAGAMIAVQPDATAYVCVDELDLSTSVPTCLHGTKVSADETFSSNCNSGRRAAVLDDGSTSTSCVVSCQPVPPRSSVSCSVAIRNNNEVMRANGIGTTQLSPLTSPVFALTRTRWMDCAATVLADGGATNKLYMATRTADGGQYGALPCEAILATADIRSAGNERFWFDPYDPTFVRPNLLLCDLEKMDAGTLTCTGQTRVKAFTTWGPGNTTGFPSSATGTAIASSTTGGSGGTLATYVWSTYPRLGPIEFTIGYSASVAPVPDLDGGQIRADMWE